MPWICTISVWHNSNRNIWEMSPIFGIRMQQHLLFHKILVNGKMIEILHLMPVISIFNSDCTISDWFSWYFLMLLKQSSINSVQRQSSDSTLSNYRSSFIKNWRHTTQHTDIYYLHCQMHCNVGAQRWCFVTRKCDKSDFI